MVRPRKPRPQGKAIALAYPKSPAQGGLTVMMVYKEETAIIINPLNLLTQLGIAIKRKRENATERLECIL